MKELVTIGSLIFGEHHESAEGFWVNALDPMPVLYSGIVAFILVLLVIGFNREIKKRAGELVPDAGFNLINFFELMASLVMGFFKDILGHDYRKYLPILLSLWFFILLNNLFGLIPFMAPATANVNTNAAMAVVVFIATHYYGVRAHGIKYFKQFLGPVPWLAPLMLPIELIGHFARVLSLTVRLFGNMFADHLVVAIFLFLVAPFVPIAFMTLGVLVCLIQALIFSILSTVYFSIAVSEEH